MNLSVGDHSRVRRGFCSNVADPEDPHHFAGSIIFSSILAIVISIGNRLIEQLYCPFGLYLRLYCTGVCTVPAFVLCRRFSRGKKIGTIAALNLTNPGAKLKLIGEHIVASG